MYFQLQRSNRLRSTLCAMHASYLKYVEDHRTQTVKVTNVRHPLIYIIDKKEVREIEANKQKHRRCGFDFFRKDVKTLSAG